MKSKMKMRRTLALVLTFAMLFTTVPFAFAADTEAKCPVCSDVEDAVLTSVSELVPATCLEDGTKEIFKCSTCNGYFVYDDAGEKYVEKTEENAVIKILSHDYSGEVRSTGKGTHSFKCVNGCDEYGGTKKCTGGTATCMQKAVCTVCNAEYGNTLEHTWDEGTVTKTANCVETGLKVFKCTAEGCTATKDEEIHTDKNVHKNVVPIEARPATCEESGYGEGKKCTACEFVIEEPEIEEPLGHQMGEEEIVVQPTCGSVGYMGKKCQRDGCDYFKKDEDKEIPATGKHYYENPKTVEPTCTEGGYTISTCVCGEICIDNKTDPKGHRYNIKETVKPTCTERGYTKIKCENCECSYIDEITDAMGHNWIEVDDEVNVAATCTTDGRHKIVCSRQGCGESDVKTLEKLGHDWSEWKSIDGKTPNCTQSGKMKRTCSRSGCREFEIDNFDELGHDWKGLTRLNGNWVGTCDRCGKELDEKIDESKYKTIESRGISLTYYDDPEYNIRTFDVDGPLTLSVLDAVSSNAYIDKYVDKNFTNRVAYDIRVLDENGDELEAKGECTLKIPLSTGFNVNDTKIYIVTDDRYVDPVYGGVETDGKGALMFEPHEFGTYLLVNESTKNAADDCECIHHSDNWFLKIMYRVLCFFWKIFKINQVCECGELHY